jgi:predicted amidohydrolase YtcJ
VGGARKSFDTTVTEHRIGVGRGQGPAPARKLANYTVVGEDPYAADPEQLNRIPVLGTVFAGRWFSNR